MNTNSSLVYRRIARSKSGLWLDDDFLWDILPRLSPLAVYVYLAVGRHVHTGHYPTVKDLSTELGRSVKMVAEACRLLKEQGLFNKHDMTLLFHPKRNL